MFESERWAEAPTVVDAIETLALRHPGAAVLDLCCGMGRTAVEFARRGYTVCGVDITPSYLTAAAEYAGDLSLELVHADARSFVRPAAFDLVVNLYNSFGYFDTIQDDALLVRNAAASLKPGGSLIVEMLGKEIAVREFTAGEEFSRNGFNVRTRYQVVDSWAGLQNTWRIEGNGKVFERSFVQRMYAGTELRQLFLENGFKEVALYGEWDGSPYDESARVLIAHACTHNTRVCS